MKLSVLLSTEEAERFCAYCTERGHKKSTLIARLIRDHLDREGYAAQPALFPAAPARSTVPKEMKRKMKRKGDVGA